MSYFFYEIFEFLYNKKKKLDILEFIIATQTFIISPRLVLCIHPYLKISYFIIS